MDGDDIGNGIEANILEENVPGIIRITETVQSALDSIAGIIKESQGEIIYRGCDDISGRIPADHLPILDEIIRHFKEKTGFSSTIGAGKSLQEAYLALRFAKCRGKGKVFVWDHK